MFSDEHQFDQVHPSPADADQKPVKDACVALFCFFLRWATKNVKVLQELDHVFLETVSLTV